jgi:hypothetical protein
LKKNYHDLKEMILYLLMESDSDPNEAICAIHVSYKFYVLWLCHHVTNPSRELQLIAVQQTPGAISNIKNPSKEILLAAVKQDPWYPMQSIKNPDKDVQLAAIKTNPTCIQFIANPDKEVQLAAVNQNYSTIRYIKNPDKDIQIAAIKQNIGALEYIKNPDSDLLELANKIDPNYMKNKREQEVQKREAQMDLIKKRLEESQKSDNGYIPWNPPAECLGRISISRQDWCEAMKRGHDEAQRFIQMDKKYGGSRSLYR